MYQHKLNNAIQFHKNKNFDAAKKLYQELIISIDDNFLPLFLLGTLELDLKNFESAIKLLKSSIDKNPHYLDTYLNLGAIYYEMKNYDACIQYYELGKSFHNTKTSESDTYYKLCLNLAGAYKNIGDLEKAKIIYEEMHSLDVCDLKIIYFLYELEAINLDKRIKKNIKQILKDKKSSYENRIYGYLLLSKYASKSDKQKEEYDLLIKFHDVIYEKNKLKFQESNDFIFNKLASINEYYDKSLNLNFARELRESLKPIFIISLPRSGSTLLEKLIVSNQKELISGEETEIFSLLGRQFFKNINFFDKFEETAKKIIDEYKNQNLISSKNILRFTDKSIDNFYYVGWIKKIFPNAIFVNCERDPKAIIVSILRNIFISSSWSHNINDIIHFIDNHYKTIEFWETQQDIEIYRVKYEKIINDFETETKNLFNYCGLNWSNEILRSNTSSKFESKTASNIQIRKPIHKILDTNYILIAEQFENKLRKYSWSDYKI